GAQKTRSDQDSQIAQTIVKGLIDRIGEAGGHTQSTSGFIMAQQNSFDMTWDPNKFWTDGIYSVAGATANHAPQIRGDIPVSNLKISYDAKLGSTKLANCLRVVFEMKNPTARRPLVLNPSKDPPLIRIVDDGAIAVGFTQKTETTLELFIRLLMPCCSNVWPFANPLSSRTGGRGAMDMWTLPDPILTQQQHLPGNRGTQV
ncbi:hypothetical protein MMC31_003508, partial [Peltigera leucophlebia]|nr:hypothetical protein [Peltigera leucophlebia]